MSDEKRCAKCDKKLRAGTPFSTCGKCRTPEEQREYWRLKSRGKDVDDQVLAGLGFGGENDKFSTKSTKVDEAPPATKKQPKQGRAPKPEIDWVAEHQALATALGMDAKQMLVDFCRGQVEHWRRKALAKDVLEVQAAMEAETA